MFGWWPLVQQEAVLWADADAAQSAAVGVLLFLQTHSFGHLHRPDFQTVEHSFLCSIV